MPSVDCSNCGEEHSVIEPMKSNHVGSIQCDECGETFIWKSPRGTRQPSVPEMEENGD